MLLSLETFGLWKEDSWKKAAPLSCAEDLNAEEQWKW